MKVIDLLNKIANGEEVPKKIKVGDYIWNYDEIDFRANDDRGYLFEVHTRINEEDLNEVVEIIEEDKKIEKLKQRTDTGLFGSMVNDEISVAEAINKQANYISDIVDKINEIIDYLEENKK